MKRLVMAVVVLAVAVLLAGNVSAGTAKSNNDMSGSKQLVNKTCDGKGVQWIGVVYNDLQDGDAMDAVSVICKGNKGEFEVPSDDFNERARVRVKCNPYEQVVGVAYKDREGKDEADGLTVICKDKKSGEERIAYNADLQGGREYVQIKDPKAVGISYNDRINSDAVDGVTLVTK